MQNSKLKSGGVFALALTLVLGLCCPSPAVISSAFAAEPDKDAIPAYMTDVDDATISESDESFEMTELQVDEPIYQDRDEYLSENVDTDIAPLDNEAKNPIDFLRNLIFGKDKASFTPSNQYMYVKYTYADAAMVNKFEAESGEKWNMDNDWQAFFAQYTGYQELLDPGEDSDYYVAFSDISDFKSLGEVIETSFTVADVSGTVVDGPFIDPETGVSYIPKHILTDGTLPTGTESDEGEGYQLALQQQIIIKTEINNDSQSSIDISTESTKSDIPVLIDEGNLSFSKFDVSFDIPLVNEQYSTAFDINDLHLYLNDNEKEEPIQVEENGYIYNSDTGVLTVPVAPCQVYSVRVVIDPDETIERAYAVQAWEMNSVPTIVYSVSNPDAINDGSSCVVGTESRFIGSMVGVGNDSKSMTAVAQKNWGPYAYGWPNNSGFSQGSSVDIIGKAAGNMANANSTTNGLRLITNYAADMNRVSAMGNFSINGCNFSSDAWTDWGDGRFARSGSSWFGLWCCHATASAAYYGADSSGRLRITVLAHDFTSANPYVVLGLISGDLGSQAGAAVYKFQCKQSGGELEIIKTVDNAPSGWTTDNYFVEGATFDLYDSQYGGSIVTDTKGAQVRNMVVHGNSKRGSIKWPTKIKAGTYWVEETKAPANCKKADKRVQVTIPAAGVGTAGPINNSIDGITVSVNKKASNTAFGNESMRNKFYNFDGIQYELTSTDGAITPMTFTLRADGSSNAILVPEGHSYKIKETKTNRWYKLNTQEYTSGNITSNYTFNVTDDPVTMMLDLTKASDNSDLLNNCKTYNLSGAKYRLTSISGNSSSYTPTGHNHIFTTDKNGYASTIEVLYDQWQVKEEYASDGHAVDANAYQLPTSTLDSKFTVANATNGVSGHKFSVKGGGDFALNPEAAEWGDFALQKVDKDSGETTPAGKASFENAVYEIKYYDTEDLAKVKSGGAQVNRTWYIATDKSGHADISTIKSGDMTVKTKQNSDKDNVTKTFKSDAPYKNAAGKIVIPVGVFTVQEVLNPEGYLFDNGTVAGPGALNYYQVQSNHSTTNAQVANHTAKYAEPVYRADVKFHKLYKDDADAADKIVRTEGDEANNAYTDGQDLARVPFALISKTTGEWHTLLTDDNGKESTEASWNSHLETTNGNDAGSAQNEWGDWISSDESKYDPKFGNWFTGFGPLNKTESKGGNSKITDTVGALPYDDYDLVEIAASTNNELKLEKRSTSVYRNTEVIDLGDIIDKPLRLGTVGIDKATASNEGEWRQEIVTIDDELTYANLNTGREYTITGTLMDKNTGEALVDDEGNTFVVKQKLVPENGDFGTTHVIFKVPGELVKAHTIVVFEQIDSTQRTEVTHADLNDRAQSINFPVIKTTATDSTTGVHEGSSVPEEITLTDKVEYWALQPGEHYTMEGTLMDKATGNPIYDGDGNPLKNTVDFDPIETDGSIDLSFTFPREYLEGKTVVVFENLWHNDRIATYHADINDPSQTVDYPKIRTIATDGETGLHHGLAVSSEDNTVTINDTVAYWNLVRGKTYTMEGVVMVPVYDEQGNITGSEPLMDGDEPFKVTKEFVAGELDGVEKKDVSAKELAATYAGIFDKFNEVYAAWKEANEGNDFVPSDELLSQVEGMSAEEGVNYIYQPNEVATYLTQLLLGDGTDEVKPYTLLVLDDFYQNTLSAEQQAEVGTIPTQEAIDAVVAGLQEIAAERAKKIEAAAAEEAADTEDTEEGTTDEQETDTPDVDTTDSVLTMFADDDAVDESKVEADTDENNIESVDEDTVDLESITGMKGTDLYDGYIVQVLVDGKWTNILNYDNIADVKDQSSYTAYNFSHGRIALVTVTGEEGAEPETKVFASEEVRIIDPANGDVTLIRYDDTQKDEALGNGIEGTELFNRYNVEVKGADGEYVSINDVPDTKYYYSPVDGNIYYVTIDEDGMESEPVMVPYTDIRFWDIEAKDFADIDDIIGNRINGTVTLTFVIPADVAAGKKTVIFEDLYADVTGDDTPEHLATHSDITDENQTVYFPSLKTTAVAKDIEEEPHRAVIDGDSEQQVTLVDTVEYSGLQPGRSYTMSGIVMTTKNEIQYKNIETGELKYFVEDPGDQWDEVLDENGQNVQRNSSNDVVVLKGNDGKEIRAQQEFTPESSSGTVDVTFTIDITQFSNNTLQNTVVFEALYTSPTDPKEPNQDITIGDVSDELILVGEHADPNDEGQSTEWIWTEDDRPPLLQTGDIIFYVIIGGLIIAAGGVTFAIIRRRRNS